MRESHPNQILHLEAALDKDKVAISLAVQSVGETQTVRRVEAFRVSMTHINKRCERLFEALNQANRRGQLPPDVLARLVDNGQLLRDDLFSGTIKQRLNADISQNLVLTLDDHLVHLPWELLHDGQQFLGQRFAMGRVVRTRQQVIDLPVRTLSHPLQMLVLADPCGDLPSAYEEGLLIRDAAESLADQVQVTFRSTGVRPDFIKAKLRHFDLVHFAGHADFGSDARQENGWRIGDDRLTADDIRRMAGTGSMPAVIFANACQSARSRPWSSPSEMQARFFDAANAFLISGVKHYLGTFWEIPDDHSACFARAFYSSLFAGQSVGAAVLAARRSVMDRFGEQSIVWAGYLLYGDPASVYFQPAAAGQSVQPLQNDPPRRIAAAGTAEMRSPEDRLSLIAPQPRSSRKWLLRAAAVLTAAAIICGFWLLGAKRGGGYDVEQQALAAFQAGQYEDVRRMCAALQRSHPQRSLGYVLMGNVHLFNGELEKARIFYQQAAQKDLGTPLHKAEAYMGLGRIASVQGQADRALDYYRKAVRLAPDQDGPLVAQALLEERSGHCDEALALLEKARTKASDSRIIEALALQLQHKIALAADQQRQARIDRLIQELAARMQADGPPPAKTAADTDSGHLTLWLTDLETVGYSLQEGTATLIGSGLMERLLQTGRIRIVERALLDGVMSEIRLGTSRLADPRTRLKLGRLTAARVILTGRVVHSPPFLQATLRCIETDTGQVFAAVNAHFDAQTAVADVVARLADDVLARLHARYPLLTQSSSAKPN